MKKTILLKHCWINLRHCEPKYVETGRYQNSVTNSNIDNMKSSLTSSKQNDSWKDMNGNVSTISNSILTRNSVAINSTQDDIKNEVSNNWNDTSSFLLANIQLKIKCLQNSLPP